jgi:hypothetical protein
VSRAGDIDDAGDDVVFNDGFAATSITLDAAHGDSTAYAWDKNGNMVLDGRHWAAPRQVKKSQE